MIAPARELGARVTSSDAEGTVEVKHENGDLTDQVSILFFTLERIRLPLKGGVGTGWISRLQLWCGGGGVHTYMRFREFIFYGNENKGRYKGTGGGVG